MNQLAIDAATPTLSQARSTGQAAQKLATDRAERDTPNFSERAEAAILAKLLQGPASGEECTDYVRASGVPIKDGRELGSLYRSMRRRGLIQIVGYCDRAKGHGTGGGKLYALGVAS